MKARSRRPVGGVSAALSGFALLTATFWSVHPTNGDWDK
jgi:hypothetical protein